MNDKERFLSKVNKTSGCWLWQGATNPDGYGRFRLNGRIEYAHRVSHRLFKGPVPDGAQVMHKCDVRSCVRPAHIRAGSTQQNHDDKKARGRCPGWKTKFTAAERAKIRRAKGSLQEVAARFGCSRMYVSLLRRNQR